MFSPLLPQPVQSRVRLCRNQFHVLWVDARWIAAGVVNLKPGRDCPSHRLVVLPMSEVSGHLAVSPSVAVALPHPAPRLNISDIRRSWGLDRPVSVPESPVMPLEVAAGPVRLLRNRGRQSASAHAQSGRVRRFRPVTEDADRFAVGGTESLRPARAVDREQLAAMLARSGNLGLRHLLTPPASRGCATGRGVPAPPASLRAPIIASQSHIEGVPERQFTGDA